MARPPPPPPAEGETAAKAFAADRAPAALLEQGDIADKDEAFGTKTLAQLRAETIQQRKDAMEAIMPERAALLKELFFLLTDKQDPARFGAGLDPTGFTLDPAHESILQEKVATFTERWIREPRVAGQIPLELPPLKPTPPPSPIRRDSTMLDMSEEVAAVERELIKPEYRKQALAHLQMNNGDRNGSNGTSGGDMPIDGRESGSPTRDGASVASSHRRQHSLVSPFPVTFHSPGFSASTPPLRQESIPFPISFNHNNSAGQEASASGSSPTLRTATTAPSSAPPQSPFTTATATAESGNSQAGPSSPPKASNKPGKKARFTSLETSDALPLRSYPVPYPPALPPLPDYMLKNRMNVGGLPKKKARDRAAAQQNPQLANSLATSADLYKLGVSRAVHSSIRSLVGAGAPPPDKVRTGGKILSTSDWQTVISEMQSQRAMERIEQLKAERTWSLRQCRKQRPPATHKAHWDYLLDEMTWLAVDFKQENRWKIATAFEIAKEIKAFHQAKTEEEKQAFQIKVGPPRFLPERTERDINGSTSIEEEDTDMVGEEIVDAPAVKAAVNGHSDEVNAEETAEVSTEVAKGMVPPASTDAERAATKTPATDIISLPTPAFAPIEPRYKKYQPQLLRARAPLFGLKLNTTVFDLSKAGLPDAYADAPTYDITSELFQELMTYGPPAEPSSDSRQNRRIDESNPNYARITNASYLLQSKPLLVSTLQPAKKRKTSGAWDDLTDIAGDEGKDLLAEMFGPGSDINFSPGTRIKDTGNKRFVPLPPANAEQRSAAMDWTPEEDRQLFIFARQYSFNWDLIASVFNDATHRPQSDARLPWDCYDRWHKKYAPLPTPAPATTTTTPALPSGAPAATPAAAGPVNGQQAPGQMAQQQAQAQAGLAQNKKDKRSGSATLAPPSATPNAVRKPDQLSRAQIRHMCIIEATKKAQKKRELQMKNNMQPALRKISLNAHESHNQPMHPGLTALELSRLKAERERQQLEELRKREQAKMYQQAQAAAMAQQQMQAQVQAQAQGQQQQGGQQQQPRGPMPAGMPGQPIMGGPQMPPQMVPGAMPQNMLPNQGQSPMPMMPGQQPQQRMQMVPGPQQMPPGMQMPPPPLPQQQGERARSVSQQHQIPRPPSQSSQHSQQAMMNGQQGPPMMNLQGSSPPMQANMLPGMHLPMQPMQQQQQMGGTTSAHSQSPQPPGLPQLSPHQIQLQLQQHQVGNPQMSPAQQQALLAQLSQMRAGSPAMAAQMPGGFPMQGPQLLTPDQQQQQLMALMRMRQNSQASSQGSVQ